MSPKAYESGLLRFGFSASSQRTDSQCTGPSTGAVRGYPPECTPARSTPDPCNGSHTGSPCSGCNGSRNIYPCLNTPPFGNVGVSLPWSTKNTPHSSKGKAGCFHKKLTSRKRCCTSLIVCSPFSAPDFRLFFQIIQKFLVAAAFVAEKAFQIFHPPAQSAHFVLVQMVHHRADHTRMKFPV